MKRLIITGGSGFVGKNLTAYMNRFYRIVNLNLRTITKEGINLDGEVVIHLAGKAHDLNKVANPKEYYDVNYDLTKKLFDAFLQSEAKKFIFVSSVKAVADKISGSLSEESIPNPGTHYGKSKLMAEKYIQSHIVPEEKSYYILRPCMIHGPGNKGNLNLLYKLVQKRIPYPLASFENKRSFLSVENLCFVIKAMLERELPSGVYNVADDEALSTNEVVSILAQSMHRKPKLWAVPSTWIQLVAKIGDKIKLPINTERLNKLTENYVVSNTKVKEALEISLPLSAQEGLRITASSFGRPKL